MTYLGDFAEDATVRRFFNTVDATGAPVTIGGTAAAQVYKDGGTTQITAGITITEDFDGVTGLHLLAVDMSADAGYTTGSDYAAVISVGTADSVSIVGGVLVQWSCENRRVSLLKDGVIGTDTFGSGVISTDVEVAGAVWDEARSSHTDSGSFGEGVVVASLAADSVTAAAIASDARAEIATAVWAVDSASSITINSVKQTLVTDIPATLATINGIVDAIVADTGELQGDWVNGGRLDLLLDTASTGATVSTVQVSNDRTWFAEEYRSRNIVTVGNGFAGTLCVVPDLNPETTIASISSVTITGAASVTASSSAVRADKQAAHFVVPALTTSGTYTVVVKVITNDSQTIPTTCVLKVV